MTPPSHAQQLDSKAYGEHSGVSLGGLNFSDLYIRLDQRAPSSYRIGPNAQGHSGVAKVPGQFEPHIDSVRTQIERTTSNVGTLTLDEMRLRFVKLAVIDEQQWAAIRRIPISPPLLTELGLDTETIRLFRSWGNRRGLIAIGGATGAGKTTTTVAAMMDYLASKNAVGFAIEDPAEYLLLGRVGTGGLCLQMEVKEEDDWRLRVMDALRSRPRYILLGEIRSPEAANQALIASQSGHLVLTTAHGGSVDETIGTILGLAEVKLGEAAARRLLATNLVAVVHQKMGRYGPDLDIVQPTPGATRSSDQVRSAINEGRIDQLRNHVKTYNARRA
ncbi:type II/IV secretion system family protein (plasmid) [Bosea sp. RAC05]|nr:type II/IV secretion system family protein [Bosea sp. RAC05]